MDDARHRIKATALKRTITRTKNAAKRAPSLEAKLDLQRRVKGLEEDLRLHNLNYFELTGTAHRLPERYVQALVRAVDEAADWRGVLAGNPDPEPLREFDAFIATARCALEMVRDNNTKLPE
jgi:hypothetical protein